MRSVRLQPSSTQIFSSLRSRWFALSILPMIFSFCTHPALQAQQPSALTQPKTISTNQIAFGIPYKVNANDSSLIEVQLYVSTDMGKSWSFQARQTTNQTEFPFRASGDGEYWFALKTLDRNRHLLPPGSPQPELRIVVDTRKPSLDFRVESDRAGRVICRWDALDENLNTNSLKILYRADAVSDPGDPQTQWQQVPVELTGKAINGRYSDQIAWWPETTSEQLSVRVSIEDHSGNSESVDRQIAVPQVTWRNKSQSTARLNEAVVRDEVEPTQPTDHKTASNVVCKDGVCVIPDPLSNDLTVPAERFAAKPNSANTSLPNASLPPDHNESLSTPSDPTTATPVAANNATAQQEQTPPPANRVAANEGQPQDQNTSNNSQPQSVSWPSDSKAPTGSQVTSTGSTQFDAAPSIPSSAMAPPKSNWSNPWDEQAPQVAEQQPAASPENSIQGDQFVSESTTRRRTQPFLERQRAMQNRPGPATSLGGQQPLPSQPNAFNSAGITNPPNAFQNVANQPDSAFSNSPFNKSNPAYQTRRVSQSVLPAKPDSAQPINSRRFQLNYLVDAIDPSGIRRVDLWMTRDDGRTWTNWGTDPDGVSPFPVEVKEQGIYGFRVVIQSKDGLTGRAPMRNDRPDMVVQVDTTAPKVEITSVPYGRGENAGRLIINWVANDSLLALRPITLSYSTTDAGPWTTIEKGIYNEGAYAWKVGPEVPEKLFLRIEAIDRAGNIGLYQLPSRIDISGLVPRGHIQSVQPVGSHRIP